MVAKERGCIKACCVSSMHAAGSSPEPGNLSKNKLRMLLTFNYFFNRGKANNLFVNCLCCRNGNYGHNG
jgi:hypothetical protein